MINEEKIVNYAIVFCMVSAGVLMLPCVPVALMARRILKAQKTYFMTV